MKATQRFHHILMYATLALALASAALIPMINVNSDMSKYLPDGSPMKKGLDVMSANFDMASSYSVPDILVMGENLTVDERVQMEGQLAAMPSVQAINVKETPDERYTLFELQTPDTINMVSMARTIRKTCGHDVIVETVQDGATPPISVIVIAALLIVAILVIMGQSWLEPFVFLLNAGVAVLINFGTNGLLPSVSITTNYIGAILQLVLSLDFSIVMMNRYRQEMTPERTSIEAMNRAIQRATRPILSSALTTVVGLLMLCFMRLKIGMDMGVVLAKGVICSLICTFTLLPSLLMLFNKACEKTAKKSFVIPTDGLGRFATRHKMSFVFIAVGLLAFSWWASRKTPIFFSANRESQIAKVFPSPNSMVLIYNPADEEGVITLADSLELDSSVQMIVSYPSLLKRQYTAEGAVDYISELSVKFKDFMPADMETSMSMDLLSNETMRIVYYLQSGRGDTIRLTFSDMMRFVASDCVDNPLFAAYISDDIRQQVELLKVMMADEGAPSPAEKKETFAPAPALKPVVATRPMPEPDPVETADPSEKRYQVASFIRQLYQVEQTTEMAYLQQITDTTLLMQQMKAGEMSDFVGSTKSQTKMVYSFSKSGKYMTPYQYVRFILDDLFQRPSLQGFVSTDQKAGLERVAKMMEYALRNRSLTAEEMGVALTQYGIPLSTQDVNDILNKKPLTKEAPLAETVLDDPAGTPMASNSFQVSTGPMKKAKPVVVPVKKKTKEEIRAEQFFMALNSKERLSAIELTKIFNKLGQNMDSSEVKLMMAFYGSINYYDEALTMSPEEILSFIGGELLQDTIIRKYFPSEMLDGVAMARESLQGAAHGLSHDSVGLFVMMANLDDESPETYAFVDKVHTVAAANLPHGYYLIGESAMYDEMRDGFSRETLVVTILTILAIFLIVVVSFRSLVIPIALIATVLSAVFINVIFSGIISGGMLYLAYLIVQSILMGATIDYGILYANYYRENRKNMTKYDAAKAAYRGSIRTIMTSGMIMVVAPGVMAVSVSDVAISSIVGCLAIGAFFAILLILFVLPAVLVALDRWVV